jgi:hypothetical protein
MRNILLFFGLAFLIAFEILRVYLIMPLPGSQEMNSIDLAYFLGSNKLLIRTIGLALIAIPFYRAMRDGKLFIRILLVIVGLLYILLFYVFTFKMEADKMFYQPTIIKLSTPDSSKIGRDKLVIGIELNGEARAYPIQLIGYHHQVVDTINSIPVMVTYCTVCRTGRVFNPVVNGKYEKFRLVGMDHFNAMFEDETTKSWWRQSTGECIAGPLKGTRLTEVQSEQVVLNAWLRRFPNSLILQGDEKFKSSFEQMDNYDKGNSKSNLTKRDTASWNPKSWVIGIEKDFIAKAYDWNQLVAARIIQDSSPNLPLVILLENDSASFHTYSRKINNDLLNFSLRNDSIIDLNSQSIWDYDGNCIEGKLKGTSLEKIKSYQEYVHSWEYFHPGSKRHK